MLTGPEDNVAQLNTLKDSAQSWLKSQKLLYPESAFIDTLQQEILWDSLSAKKDPNHQQTVLYIPVRYNSNYTGLIVTVSDEKRSVTNGYFSEISSSYSNASPAQFIENFYLHKNNTLSAKITAFDLSNSFEWELGYNNGNYKYKKIVNSSNNSNNRNSNTSQSNSQASDCTDYYLITYYDDGSQESQYLGELCRPCYNERRITGKTDNLSVSCGGTGAGNGGGGGGTSTPSTTTTTNNAPLSVPSQAQANLTKLPNGQIKAIVTNSGLFLLANISVNFTFDPAKKIVDPASVTTNVLNGVLVGTWTQTSVTGLSASGNDIFFTINATVTITVLGSPFPLYCPYIINVDYNTANNTAYFDNQDLTPFQSSAGHH